MMALVLILWVSENALAQFLSPGIEENFPSWTLAGEIQVAQAVPEAEDSSLAGSAAFFDFENRFATFESKCVHHEGDDVWMGNGLIFSDG